MPFGGLDFSIDETYRWKNEKFKFVYMEFSYSIGDEWYSEGYSPYTASEINAISWDFYVPEKLYYMDKDYSFVLSDYDKDTTAPEVDIVSVVQNGRYLDITYSGKDTQSGIYNMKFSFDNDNGDSFTIGYNEYFRKEKTFRYDLLEFFPNVPYGTYNLKSIYVEDRVYNSTRKYIDGSYPVVLSADNNPLVSIPTLEASVETDYIEGKIFLRKGSGLGSDNYYLRYYDSLGDRIFEYANYINKDDYDYSKLGNHSMSDSVEITITPGVTYTKDFTVDIEVVDVVGDLIVKDYDKEICLTYEEYKNQERWRKTSFIDVELFDGTIINHEMCAGGAAFGMGQDKDLPYYGEEFGFYYNPKYKKANDDDEYYGSISLHTRFYIMDANGNLLDNNGNLRVKYEDRKDVKHKTLNDAVNITSLEGSIPTYSVVNAEETNVDNVFDSEAIAYDITLVADGENVQPVDDVTVSVALPSELSGKEVEVYYVDDNNNKTLIDSTCTNNTVSFDTGHFSTYAVVEKKMPTSYTLYVDLNGGVSEKEIASEREMAIGAYIDLPRSGASRKGYTFDGWQYVDASGNVIGDGTVPSRMPTSDVYVVAKWNPQTYRIALNQSDLPGISFTVESEDFTLPIPEREGYTFVGWQWTDGDGSVAREVVIPKGTMFSRYYTAIWEKIREYDVYRIFGNDRYETAYKVADEYKALLKVDKFSAIIVANGANFADALAGSYLSSEKSAPILMTDKKEANINKLVEYAKANLQENGTVYILGGTAAVSDKVDKALSAYQIKRLAGKNRYETNMLILKAAGYEYFTDELVIATGTNFADSLSVSATGKPIMLVGNSLTAEQRRLISRQAVSSNTDSIYIVGGTSAVNKKVENAIKDALPKRSLNFGNGDSYDISAKVERIAGDNRYETSVLVAKKFFPTSEKAVLAYAKNYPDGLSGGALAKVNNAPLLLVDGKNYEAATKYGKEAVTTAGYVLGGNTLVTDEATKAIFAMQEGSTIVNK